MAVLFVQVAEATVQAAGIKNAVCEYIQLFNYPSIKQWDLSTRCIFNI